MSMNNDNKLLNTMDKDNKSSTTNKDNKSSTKNKYNKPSRTKNHNRKKIIHKCEKCGHENTVHRTARLNKNKVIDTNTEDKTDKEIARSDDKYTFDHFTYATTGLDFPLCVEIKHQGFWITNYEGIHIATDVETCDKNSVMLKNECLLYTYKLAMRHLLLSMNVISPTDIDAANLVPHMVVRKNKADPFSKYKVIQNNKFIITEKMISIKNNFALIEIDEQRDLHFTLIYSKNIRKKVDLMKAIKTIITILNEFPNLIAEYGSLPYFGQNLVSYWYENPDSFPFQMNPPIGYVSKSTCDTTTFNVNTTAAGSIIQDKLFLG